MPRISLQFCALFTASLNLAACAPPLQCGAGTHVEGNLCVAGTLGSDAGLPEADGGSTWDAGLALATGDLLFVGTRNRGSDMELLVDTRVCFFLSVLHRDGTRTPVPPGSGVVSLEATTPGVVIPAEAVDCAGGGLIGVGVGVTAVQVRLSSGGVTISGTGSASVRGGGLVLAPELAGPTAPFSVVVGATTHAKAITQEGAEGWGYLAGLRFEWRPAAGTKPRDAQLLARWLKVVPTNGSLVTVEQLAGNGGDLWRFVGRAAGTTTVTVTYDGPHGAVQASRPLNVVPRPPPSPDDLIGLVLLSTEGRFLESGTAIHLPAGTCFVPRMFLSTMNDPYTTFDVDGAYTLTSLGAASTSPGANGSTCLAGNGVTRLTGCAAGRCTTRAISAYEPGAIARFEVTALSSAPVGGTIYLDELMLCSTLRATVTLVTGQAFDVSTISDWMISSAADTRLNSRLSGFQPFSPPGADLASPCFRLALSPTGTSPLSGPGTSPVTATATWGDLSASVPISLRGTFP